MHVDSFWVGLFQSYGEKKERKLLKSRDDRWTNIKHYANVNEQMTFLWFPCAGCRVLMVYKYGSRNLFGNKIAGFWFSDTFKVSWMFPPLWRSTERRKGLQLLCIDASLFIHTDCCLSVCASVNDHKFSHSGQRLFLPRVKREPDVTLCPLLLFFFWVMLIFFLFDMLCDNVTLPTNRVYKAVVQNKSFLPICSNGKWYKYTS